MKWMTIFIVFILNFSLMIGFGWKRCSQMFVRVWNHIIGAHKKPFSFFFSPLEFVWKCLQGFEKARTTIWKMVLYFHIWSKFWVGSSFKGERIFVSALLKANVFLFQGNDWPLTFECLLFTKINKIFHSLINDTCLSPIY